MKKIVSLSLIIVLLSSMLFALSGCNNKEEEQEAVLKYTISDSMYGLVALTYDESTPIKLDSVKTDDGRESEEYYFSSDSLNVDADVYFTQGIDLERNMEDHKEKDGYQELSFNNGQYKGYAYAQTSVNSDYKVYIDVYDYAEGESQMYDYILLYMDLEKKDPTIETDLKSAFDSSEVQNVLNTMVYSKANN